MTTTIGTIQLIATIDTSRYKKNAKDIDKTTKNMEGSVDKGSKSFVKMGAVAGATAAVIGNVLNKAINSMTSSIDGAVKRVDTFNNFPKVMANLGFNAEDAEKQVTKLSEATEGLPTPLDSIVSAMQQIAPAASSMDEATDITLALNNALLASGKSTEEQTSAFNQFVQAIGRGRPDLIELRSFASTAPGQFRQIAQSLGLTATTADGVNEAFKDGTITMDDFTGAIVKLNEDGLKAGGKEFASFEQQARDATGGIGTSMSRIQSAISRNIAKIITTIGAENITGFFDNLRTGIDDFTNLLIDFGREAQNVGEQVGEFLLPKIEVFWRTINEDLIPALKTLWKDVIEPLVPVFGVLLVGAIGLAIDQLNFWVSLFSGIINEIKAGNPIVIALAGAFGTLAAVMAFNAIFNALTVGFATLRLVTIPQTMASISALRALIMSPTILGAIAIGAALAAIKKVFDALGELNDQYDKLNSVRRQQSELNDEFIRSLRAARDRGDISEEEFIRRGRAFQERRANGGPVSAGVDYLVGERGPEVFVPDVDGEIIPNHRVKQGNDITINLQGVFATSPAEQRRVAEQIASRLQEIQKSRGFAGGVA